MDSAAKKIIDYAVSHGYTKQEQYEEYVYMLTLVLNIIVTDISTLIISILMHMVWECIVFWLMYKALRKYCGGFHFSTSVRCYLSTIIMCPIVLYIIKSVPISIVAMSAITTVSALILFVLSPVEAVTKPLDDIETAVFGKVARILSLIALIIYFTFVIFKFYAVAKVLTVSIASVTAFTVAGKIHLMVLNKKQLKASV